MRSLYSLRDRTDGVKAAMRYLRARKGKRVYGSEQWSGYSYKVKNRMHKMRKAWRKKNGPHGKLPNNTLDWILIETKSSHRVWQVLSKATNRGAIEWKEAYGIYCNFLWRSHFKAYVRTAHRYAIRALIERIRAKIIAENIAPEANLDFFNTGNNKSILENLSGISEELVKEYMKAKEAFYRDMGWLK